MRIIKRTITPALAFLLALLMAIYLFPADVAAAAYGGNDPESQSNEQEEETVEALFELTDLRTEDTKYIMMSDGTIQALVYDTAVHVQDESGVWQDIDNRLTVGNNTVDSARVKFAKKITGNGELFTLHDGNKKVTLSLADAIKKTPVTVVNDGTTDEKYATKLEELSTLSKVVSSVRYNGILPNTDVEYILSGNDLKENIFINALQDYYTYTFELALNNLTAVLSEDGSIVLSEGEETVYTIPVPYMYDAEGAFSDAVSYTLTEANGNGKYALTITANADWINDSDRTFPITVDPTITLNGNNATNASVSSDGGVYSYYMDAGVASGVSYRSYISFTLPSLPDGSIVTEAVLKLYQDNYHYDSANTAYIAVRQITSSWTASSLRWANKPNNSEDVLDYATVSSTTTGSRLSFDITPAYKKWNAGSASNYGVMLSAVDESDCGGYVQLGGTGFASNKRPILEVNFRNTRGIEDRFTYQTMNVGNAGVLYLSDNSLEKTVIKNITYTNAGSVDLVYNSVGASAYPVSSNMLQIAKGWSLSVQQTITTATYSPHEYAVWVDEDGTSHYYDYASGNGFIDEDNNENVIYLVGLNVMSVDLSEFNHDDTDYSDLEDDYRTYLLVKSTGEKALFYNGALAAAVDSVGNITEYHYNESTPSSAKSLPSSSAKTISSVYTIEKTDVGYETAEFCVSFAKSGNDTVITVTDEDPVVLHANTNGDLVNIIRNSDPIATYTYSNHKLYDLRDVEEGYGFVFSLNGMTEMNEYFVGENNVVETGRKVYITGGGTHTTYVDHRNDSNVALLVNYLFDKAGRTVCTYANDFLFNVYSAANFEYDKAIGGSSSRSDIYSATGTLPWNLLLNSSAETISAFTNAVYSNDRARTGFRSLALTNNSSSPETTIRLTSGQPYTFSAYVNLEEATSLDACGGAYLKASKGSEEYSSYKLFTKTDSESQWQRIYLTFTPASTGTYTLSLNRSGICGTIYFDDLQLETGKDLSDYSYVSNGAFAAQNGWTCSDSTTVSYTTEETPGVAEWSCVKVSGIPSARGYATQEVALNSVNKSYTLSGWAKAKAVSLKEERPGEERTFGLIAVIDYADTAIEDETVYIPFSADIRGEWQFISGRVTPASNQIVDKITVYAAYDYNCDDAYFTGISMVESNVYTATTSTTEESEGETDGESEEELETVSEEPETVSLSEMLSCLGIDSNTFASYLSGQTLDGNIVYTVENENSSVYTKTFTNKLFYATVQQDVESDASRTWYTMTLSVYNADGNLICTEDTFGGVTRYTYTDGVMTAETSPLGTVTEYTYSGEQLISASIANKARVQYGYTRDRLTGVTAGLNDEHGTQGYSFEYNSYGQLVSVKAGTYTLINYTYDNDGINVKSVAYANGLTISYVYDMLDRIVEIKYNGNARYRCAYTGGGSVLSIEDLVNNTKKVYLENENTNTVITVNSLSNNVIATTYTTRNTEGQVLSVKEGFFIGSTWNEETNAYTYNEDGDLTSINAGGVTQNYTYDALKRVIGVGNSSFAKSIVYRTNYGRTCELVSGISYARAGTTLLSLEYTYDAAGNIETVSKGGVIYNRYTYDELGQLVREDNRDANKSYTYSYDSRGNILEKKTYVFSLGSLGSAQRTDNYGYAADSWKDRLTSYNNNPITYDNGGNPLSYNNGSAYTFTWEGRQLQTAKKGSSSTWTYTYNADGLRIGKSNGTTSYTYSWNENRQLQSMTWNDGYAIFSYDADGAPYSVQNYDALLDVERNYLYVTNLQGDVLAIIDEASGQTAVSYQYDAWGKLISKNGTSSDYASIYEYNPLTYRGYVCDSETGLYYLQSRYYDPCVGRFITSDDAQFLGYNNDAISFNLFSYCLNNPINNSDYSGCVVTPANVVGAVIGAIGGGIIGLAIANYFNLGWPWRGLVIGSVSVALTVVGWFAGPAVYAAIKPAIIAAINAGTLLINKLQVWVYQALGFTKDWIITRATNFLVKHLEKLSVTTTVSNHFNRPYQNLLLLVREIMQSSKPVFDNSLSFGLKWVVKGTLWGVNSHGIYEATTGVYELVIDVLKMRIVHFLFRSL